MNWQIEILQYLELIRNDFLTMLITTITIMAESLFLVTVIALLYWCVDKVKSIRLAWFILFNGIINGAIKNIVRMPRPFQTGAVMPLRVETATGYAFPSGHTQSATSFWGGSMLIFKSRGCVVIGLMMILATAFSRLYLGVHWPIDVLGGILFGVIGIYLADVFLGEQAVIRNIHIILASSVVILVILLPVDGDFYKAAAALWGMTLGLYLEQRYVHFEPKQRLKLQIVKVIIGFLGIIIIYVGLKKLFAEEKLFEMLRYSCVLLWITVGAPYLFTKIKI